MHRRAGFGDTKRQHALDHLPGKQGLRQLADGLGRGTLPHSDQHSLVANRHDIAPFEGRQPVIDRRVAPVNLGTTGKVRVELVNRRIQQRLRAAGIPEHRVDHHTVVDPGAVVPGKERVRQRRQHKSVMADVTAEQPRRLKGQLLNGQAAKQMPGQQLTRNLCHPADQFGFCAYPDLIRRNPVVEYPAARLGVIEGFGQQGVDVQHLHALVAHQLGKYIVILLRLLHPKDVIKQQLLAIAGGQTPMRQPRPANNHLTQPPCFGVNAQLLNRHILSPYCIGQTLTAERKYSERQ